jgi:sugar (pentulose or hexulose) kinase
MEAIKIRIRPCEIWCSGSIVATQSTKVLVVDAKNGKVLACGPTQSYELIPNLPPGAKEQHPHTWRDATAAALRQALRGARANPTEVRALGVSGQQHGFVPLDRDGNVIRPAKLWCDTTTTAKRRDHRNTRRPQEDPAAFGQCGPAWVHRPQKFCGSRK